MEINLDLDQLVARECECDRRLCEASGVTYPGDVFVAQAIKMPEFSINWRFVPEGLGQVEPLRSCRLSGIKLNGGAPEAASEKGRENFVTESSLIHCPLFIQASMDGRPFNLTVPQQMAWSAEQGGQGLMFAHEW